MKLTKVGTSPFFRASCGCIGLDVGEDQWCFVHHCSYDPGCDDPIYLSQPCYFFDESKDYTPLSADETRIVLTVLSRLIHGGQRLNDLKRIMEHRYQDDEKFKEQVHAVFKTR